MKDNFNRDINYMRISVTDRCNYRCKYCMPEGCKNIGHDNILTFEEIERIVKAAVELGITKFRLTGGEPLVRKGILNLVKNISKIDGVEELVMTTNGSLLKDYAKDLKDAALARVNISLDTLKHTRFQQITGGGHLDDVFAGINAATRVGLKPVKINTVMIRGFNDDEIMDFVQLTLQHEYDVRFIELMPIGDCAEMNNECYISCKEMMERLPGLKAINGEHGVADTYKYPAARGTLGFISPISSCFCSNCNKIRLTADGKLKTCLHSNQEIDLKPALASKREDILKEVLKDAVLNKEEKHHLEDGQVIERNMNKIGG